MKMHYEEQEAAAKAGKWWLFLGRPRFWTTKDHAHVSVGHLTYVWRGALGSLGWRATWFLTTAWKERHWPRLSAQLVKWMHRFRVLATGVKGE